VVDNTPLSPPSAPIQGRLQDPPAKSKFLALAGRHSARLNVIDVGSSVTTLQVSKNSCIRALGRTGCTAAEQNGCGTCMECEKS